MERKTREVGAMPTWNRLSFMCCVVTFVFPTFNIFKVVYHEYPCAFSVRSVMLQSQERTPTAPTLDQKVLSRLIEYDDVFGWPPSPQPYVHRRIYRLFLLLLVARGNVCLNK